MEKTQFRFLGLPIWEKRSEGVLSNLDNPKEWLTQIMGNDTFSGVKVNSDTALKISTVWACTRILSNTLAQTPAGVQRKDANGDRVPFHKHPVHFLIHNEPNQLMGAFRFKQAIQAHAVLKGNGYAIIKRNGAFRPVELELIENPDTVQPYKYEGRLFYKIEGFEKPFTSDEIFHIAGPGFDGVKGKSILTVARESIGSALAQQEYGNRVFASGGAKRTAITHPKTLGDKAKENIRKSWEKEYSGLDKSGKVAFLEMGVDVKEIGMNPEDAQFILSKEFSVNDIARFFGVILDLLATDKNPTYGSAEQRAIDFIKYTMMPWYITWEEEFNRKLFRRDEKQTIYTKFNLSSLLRGDSAARAKYYKDLFYIGALSRNEIRALEDRNKIEDGDSYYLQTNMVQAENLGNIQSLK